MKKCFALLMSLVLVSLTVCPVLAHSGRTDSNGGHWDNSTGEYHYHHGYPAHDHVNGICPYDFDDQTNHDGGTSTVVEATPTVTPTRRPTSTIRSSGGSGSSGSSGGTKASVAQEVSSSRGIDWSSLLPLAFYVIPIGLFIIWGIIEDRRKKKRKKAEYEEKYTGKTYDEIAKMCGMPLTMELDSQNKPKLKGTQHALQFFVAKSGYVYHWKRGCSQAFISADIDKIYAKRPCQRCSPPKIAWYHWYLQELKEIRKYGIRIDEPGKPEAQTEAKQIEPESSPAQEAPRKPFKIVAEILMPTFAFIVIILCICFLFMVPDALEVAGIILGTLLLLYLFVLPILIAIWELICWVAEKVKEKLHL